MHAVIRVILHLTINPEVIAIFTFKLEVAAVILYNRITVRRIDCKGIAGIFCINGCRTFSGSRSRLRTLGRFRLIGRFRFIRRLRCIGRLRCRLRRCFLNRYFDGHIVTALTADGDRCLTFGNTLDAETVIKFRRDRCDLLIFRSIFQMYFFQIRIKIGDRDFCLFTYLDRYLAVRYFNGLVSPEYTKCETESETAADQQDHNCNECNDQTGTSFFLRRCSCPAGRSLCEIVLRSRIETILLRCAVEAVLLRCTVEAVLLRCTVEAVLLRCRSESALLRCCIETILLRRCSEAAGLRRTVETVLLRCCSESTLLRCCICILGLRCCSEAAGLRRTVKAALLRCRTGRICLRCYSESTLLRCCVCTLHLRRCPKATLRRCVCAVRLRCRLNRECIAAVFAEFHRRTVTSATLRTNSSVIHLLISSFIIAGFPLLSRRRNTDRAEKTRISIHQVHK